MSKQGGQWEIHLTEYKPANPTDLEMGISCLLGSSKLYSQFHNNQSSRDDLIW